MQSTFLWIIIVITYYIIFSISKIILQPHLTNQIPIELIQTAMDHSKIKTWNQVLDI